MTLILLAISLTVALCVIAYNFAIYARPFTFSCHNLTGPCLRAFEAVMRCRMPDA